MVSFFCILQWKKIRKIPSIFDIEKWLWKSDLCCFRPSKMTERAKNFLWCFHDPLALLIHLDTAACRKISEIMDHLQGCNLKFPLNAIPEYFHMSAVFGHLHSAKNPWTRSFALNDVFCLHRKFYIPNTLNNDQFWHPQWVVAALKY